MLASKGRICEAYSHNVSRMARGVLWITSSARSVECVFFFSPDFIYIRNRHTLWDFGLRATEILKKKTVWSSYETEISGNSRVPQNLSKLNKEKYIHFYHVIKTDSAKTRVLQRPPESEEQNASIPMWDILIKQTSYREKCEITRLSRISRGNPTINVSKKQKTLLSNGIYVGYIFLLCFVVQLQ